MTYILIDLSNLFYRARHSIQGNSDIKLGMAFHITFSAIRKCWNDFNGSHIMVALEGKSWRKQFYAPYKRNRSEMRAAMSPKEQAEEQLFWEAFEDFKNFLIEKTNCTVLHHPQLEADDLIAGFIQQHPQDNHVIISTDSDFHQLIAPNVSQYNGISDVHITYDGFYDAKGKQIKDNKTGQFKAPIDPEWMLFEKCMRGDKSDNVFSAYPGARIKGTRNKVGLLEAFNDRNTKGYNWNNLQLHRWTDHNGVEHRVLDDYERNRILIDLSAQPSEIRTVMNEVIDSIQPKNITQVGIRMLKFCQSYDMKRMMDNIQSYAIPFQANYPT